MLCATALLGFIFGPKIYIMVSYEPVVVEMHPQQALKDFFSNQELFEKGAKSLMHHFIAKKTRLNGAAL